ncbi:endonuclease/exonuclease/phosphatase family protein [Nocardioides marmotae]|uniref:endonuclease/exonuclease/phosphatase family protein n=1 Tax=Nocardioides marmotae TaxID=2663857 RepID=UPI0012B589D7|nr:endonuclease/exonuclease/phosphatase family protein [Nocardioides marmotae]MBC9734653.1 hypothetical protein [Nocardioides marmotae]MTB85755.1 hypothetical protein [Nocardioides marmotae]
MLRAHTPTGIRGLPVAAALALLLAASLLVGAPARAATEPSSRPGGKPTGFGFKIGTFNVLGSQHTRGRGGYAPGTQRARWTAGAITQRGIDVIGLQEVQRDQLRVLRNRMPGYRIWPGTALGNQGVRLQIAFRTKQFRLVGHGHVMTRFHRQTRPIPWVELRDRRTDRRFFVVDVHNSPKGLERERDSATAKQVRLVQRLRRKGAPVFVTADANEKREFYCKMTSRTDLRAANGGKPRARGCQPPRRRLRIDWVLGGKKVVFSHYREDRGPRVRRSSDHELVHARVRVKPLRRR